MNYTFTYQQFFIAQCEKYFIHIGWDAYDNLGFDAILHYESYPLAFETEEEAEVYARHFLREEDDLYYSIEKTKYAGIVTMCTVENLKYKMEIIENIIKEYNYEEELGKYEIYYSECDVITIEFENDALIDYDMETDEVTYYIQGLKSHSLEHAATLITIMRAIAAAMSNY